MDAGPVMAVGLLVLCACVYVIAAAFFDASDRRTQCTEFCEALDAEMTFVNDYGCVCSEPDTVTPGGTYLHVYERGR